MKGLFKDTCLFLAQLDQWHAPKDSTGGPGKILTEVEQFSILQSLIYNTSAFLHEIQAQLCDSTGKWIRASTICWTIHQHNFTHKKIQVIALQ